MIEFNDVCFGYGSKKVVKNLSFVAEPGKCTVLAGPNGVGKSTVLALAAGALRPDSGHIRRSGRLGYAPQEAALFEDLSVKDNLKFFARVCNVPIPSGFCLPIGDVLRKKVGKLSGGMRKRVSIVCADLGAPLILLLDEPCAGLDVASQQMLLAQISKWKQEGRCILYAGHDPEELRAVCDRLVLMNGEHTTVLDPGEVEDLPALLRSATQ